MPRLPSMAGHAGLSIHGLMGPDGLKVGQSLATKVWKAGAARSRIPKLDHPERPR